MSATLTDLNGYDPNSFREGKKGPVKFFFDPTHVICRAFGGRRWFAEEGVITLHRVGLLYGLGWLLPYTGGNQDINSVRIVWTKDPNGRLFNMYFSRVNTQHPHPPETTQLVEKRLGVDFSDLLKVYKEVVG